MKTEDFTLPWALDWNQHRSSNHGSKEKKGKSFELGSSNQPLPLEDEDEAGEESIDWSWDIIEVGRRVQKGIRKGNNNFLEERSSIEENRMCHLMCQLLMF